MRIVFVGGYPPRHLVDESCRWGGSIDYAAYTFQAAIVDGLDLMPADLRILSTLYISAYPKSSKLFLRRESYSHKEKGSFNDVFTGFVNIPIIKRLSILWRTYKELRKMVDKSEETVVVNYALSSDKLLPIFWLRKRFDKTCCIIPDLPEYMSENRSLLFRIGKWVDRRIICHCLRGFDMFAILSPFMRERLPIKEGHWIQIEGIYNPKDQIKRYEKGLDGKIVVFYSGALNIRYGVGDLVEAFRIIKGEEYELWLCGAGDAISMIEENAAKDSRIKYFGALKRNEVLMMQRQATLLVNPRHKAEEYTRYSFPSKTMEYMASARPVIMSHLESIPQEYEEFLFFFDDETPDGMAKKIKEICNKPEEELNHFGNKAAHFILTQKTSAVQAKRLFDFITTYSS